MTPMRAASAWPARACSATPQAAACSGDAPRAVQAYQRVINAGLNINE